MLHAFFAGLVLSEILDSASMKVERADKKYHPETRLIKIYIPGKNYTFIRKKSPCVLCPATYFHEGKTRV